jgi:hypothetical protein
VGAGGKEVTFSSPFFDLIVIVGVRFSAVANSTRRSKA